MTTALPTIKDIALDLYYSERLDYTEETNEAVAQDDREGFEAVVISSQTIVYAKDGQLLKVQEVVGMDEDLNETPLDYLYSIEDAEGYSEESGTDSAEELIQVIRRFMA